MAFDFSTAKPVNDASTSSGFDLSTAKPVNDQPTQNSGTDYLRQLALVGKAAATGVYGALSAPNALIDMGVNAAAHGVNSAFGTHLKDNVPTGAQNFSSALDSLGAYSPETAGENLASAGVTGLTGGLTGLGAIGSAATLPNAIRAGTSGVTSSLGSEGARQLGLPGWAQFAVGILGGQIPSFGESTVRTLGDLASPLVKSGQKRMAGNIFNDSATDRNASLFNLDSSAPIVPGSMPTTGPASQDFGLLSLEKGVRGKNPDKFAERASEQNAARQAELTAIGGTPNDLQAAITNRTNATSGLYSRSELASAPVDKEFTSLMQRPAMQQAVSKAKEIAGNQGHQFNLSTESPNVTGANLQNVRQALDDRLSELVAKDSRPNEIRALRTTLGDYNDWVSRNVPELRAADAAFKEHSGPVNSMTSVQDLQNRGSLTSADVSTGNYFLSPSGYSRALDRMQENPLHGVSPASMARLEAVRKDLENSQAINGPLLKAPGSDTFQNLAINQNMLGIGQSGGWLTKPLSWIYNKGGVDNAVNEYLVNGTLDPRFAASLMRSAAVPKSRPNFVYNDIGSLGGLFSLK